MTYDAVDALSSGATVPSGAATHPAATTCDDPATLVRDARTAGTTQKRARSDGRALSALVLGGVAAKTLSALEQGASKVPPSRTTSRAPHTPHLSGAEVIDTRHSSLKTEETEIFVLRGHKIYEPLEELPGNSHEELVELPATTGQLRSPVCNGDGPSRPSMRVRCLGPVRPERVGRQ